MIALEIFQESLSSLWQNKSRTFLSVLGIVIGIGSVISMMAIGQGSQAQITEQIQELGTNTISLYPRSSEPLTTSDLEIILANDYTGIFTGASPEINNNQTLVVDDDSESVSVTGVTDTYLSVRGKTIAVGSFFDEADFAAGNRVIAIGNSTAENFFGSASAAIGQRIKVGSIYFTITGVFKEGGSSGGFMDPDDFAVIPISVMQNEITGSRSLSTISFAVTSEDQVERAKSIIGYTMLARHGIESVDDADFSIFAATDLLETLSSITGTMTLLIAGIAGISLLVGGIGIMNVMLMSVLERTREIGLRKALGAKQIHLISQFLFEAVLITVVGGLLGLGIGLGVSWIFSHFTALEARVTLSSVATAIGISTAIGLIFGIYPARKAAKLAPIEALRTE